jgi:hypothetical protein
VTKTLKKTLEPILTLNRAGVSKTFRKIRIKEPEAVLSRNPSLQLRLMWALIISVKPIASMFFGQMLNFFKKWRKKRFLWVS